MILVDSDVLIAHLRGVSVARDWLVERRWSGASMAISVVSVTEICGGMRSPERVAVERLLTSFDQLPVDAEIAREAGELMRRYRRSHQAIGIGDHLIAATAQVVGAELATLNVEHFPMFRSLKPPFRVLN